MKRHPRCMAPLDRAVPSSGCNDELDRCFLPRRLSGAALNSVLLSFSKRGLVRIDWIAASTRSCSPETPIGSLTELGRKTYEEWLSA